MTNYQLQLDILLDSLAGARPSLLLHACCAPCASYVLEYLTSRFDITVYFFNPNIQPQEEYELRLSELKRLQELLQTPENSLPLIEGKYYNADWGDCSACQEFRIRSAAKLAADGGFDYFCSTLSISPHKNAELLNALGSSAEAEYGSAKWLPNDFKKRNGYLRSTQLCREYGIYRQAYCGCASNR
jgi:predicted adenine nucleotide alpha hydrolase (AANH) superfamily ATPase